MLTTLALFTLLQDGTDEKLAKMRELRARMKAEIEKVDADIKEMEAHAKAAKAHRPQDDSGLADEVRALRKEVAELRALIKESAATRDFRKAVEAPVTPKIERPMKAEKAPPPIQDGRMTLKLGEDAGPVKEVWIYRAGEKEPMRFTLTPVEKKAEKKEKRPDKAEKKPNDTEDEQLEERRGLLRRMYENRKKAEDPEARRLMDEMKKDDARIEQGRKTLQKLIEEETPKCECEEECPFKQDSPPRAAGIWY